MRGLCFSEEVKLHNQSPTLLAISFLYCIHPLHKSEGGSGGGMGEGGPSNMYIRTEPHWTNTAKKYLKIRKKQARQQSKCKLQYKKLKDRIVGDSNCIM